MASTRSPLCVTIRIPIPTVGKLRIFYHGEDVDGEDAHLHCRCNATSTYECVQHTIPRMFSALFLSNLDNILFHFTPFRSRRLLTLNHIRLSIKLRKVSKIAISITQSQNLPIGPRMHNPQKQSTPQASQSILCASKVRLSQDIAQCRRRYKGVVRP